MKFSVMSRQNARKFSFGNIPEKTIIVSITDVQSDFNHFKRQANLIGVCDVKFDDVERGEENCITKQDAQKILAFVNRYKDVVEHIIVHCEAGVSRSAGVCAALMHILTGNDMAIFDNPRFTPNMTCYRMVMNEYYEKLNEEEIAEKEAHNLDVWKKENDVEER